jgi:hypothetical protein
MTLIQKGTLSKTFLTVVSLVVVANCASGTTFAKASGLRGTTSFKVWSGVPGGATTQGPATVEFAIVPMQGDRPVYEKAIFAKSDKQGKYEVALPPGRYWIGPKAKALDPKNYHLGSATFSETQVIVQEGKFTEVDLLEERYAP